VQRRIDRLLDEADAQTYLETTERGSASAQPPSPKSRASSWMFVAVMTPWLLI